MGSTHLSDWTPRHTFTAADPPQPHHWTAPSPSPTGREFLRLDWDP